MNETREPKTILENVLRATRSTSDVPLAVEAAAQRTRELVNGTAAPDREALAKSLGWPSPDALVAFLFDGPSAGGTA